MGDSRVLSSWKETTEHNTCLKMSLRKAATDLMLIFDRLFIDLV